MPMHYALPPILVTALFAFPNQAALADDQTPNPQDVRFFEMRVRPLLADRCFKCHGPTKQKADLRLDSAEAIKKGGDSGRPLISKTKPSESLLLQVVRHEAGVEAMPPTGELSAVEIATLDAWVKRGAPFYTPTSTEQTSADH